MSSLRTASRLALMTGAAFFLHSGAVLAQDATFTNNSNVNSYVIPTPQAPDTYTVINNARIGPSGLGTTTVDNLVLSSGVGTGSLIVEHNAQAVVTTDGRINGPAIIGRVDLSGISGGAELNVNDGALWRTAGESLFGAGNDALNIAEGGVLSVGKQLGSSAPNATAEERNEFVPPVGTNIDFGTGLDVMDNAGVIIVGGRLTANDPSITFANHEAQLTFEGLEEFHHSGVILLGGFRNTLADSGTDGWFDDILSMPGADFIGEGGRILFDIDINGVGQTSCDGALRDPTTGDMPGGDCIAIAGGSTEGTTDVVINDIFGGDRGAYNPEGTVLVDVSGGTSAQEHFVLSPDSDFYSSEHGGVLDKGVFFYSLLYDEDTQQHKLVGLAGGNAMQLPLLADAAHDLWRLSAGSGLDRRAGLRGDPETGEGGAWLRVSSETGNRDVVHSTGAYGATFDFDNTYEQSSYAISGGLDLLRGGDANFAYVLGVMAGYGYTEMAFDASPNTATLDSWTGGAYANFASGGFFLDAALSAGKGDLKVEMPALDLFPAGTILNTHLLSVGAEVEAGWRLQLGGAFIEPLAGLSYVRTNYDEMVIPSDDPARSGLAVDFGDPASLRASVGARLGLDQDHGGFSANYSVLGRVWNEFEGETAVNIHNTGPTAALLDEFTGTFTDLSLGVSLRSDSGAMSGFLNVGGKFGDDYDAQTGSAGVRVNW